MADADTTEDRYIALLQRAGDSESFKAGETIFAEGDRSASAARPPASVHEVCPDPAT
jgi:hypothetical protein